MEALLEMYGGDFAAIEEAISFNLSFEYPGVVAGFAYRVLALGALIRDAEFDLDCLKPSAFELALSREYRAKRSSRNKAQRRARRVTRRAS